MRFEYYDTTNNLVHKAGGLVIAIRYGVYVVCTQTENIKIGVGRTGSVIGVPTLGFTVKVTTYIFIFFSILRWLPQSSWEGLLYRYYIPGTYVVLPPWKSFRLLPHMVLTMINIYPVYPRGPRKKVHDQRYLFFRFGLFGGVS